MHIFIYLFNLFIYLYYIKWMTWSSKALIYCSKTICYISRWWILSEDQRTILRKRQFGFDTQCWNGKFSIRLVDSSKTDI